MYKKSKFIFQINFRNALFKSTYFINLIAIFFIGVFIFLGCSSGRDCLESEGKNWFQQRRIQSNFWAIKLYDNINLVIDSLQNTTLQVQAKENIIDQIQTSFLAGNTQDTILNISNIKTCNWVRSFANQPTITLPHTINFRSVYHYGWGQITNLGILKLPELTLSLYTASNILLNLNCQNLRVEFNGTGKLELNGKGDYLFIWAKKFPDIRLSRFKTKRCDFYMDSSKDIFLSVTDTIRGQIDGSGNVYVIGNPYIFLNPNSKGTGRIIIP